MKELFLILPSPGRGEGLCLHLKRSILTGKVFYIKITNESNESSNQAVTEGEDNSKAVTRKIPIFLVEFLSQ